MPVKVHYLKLCVLQVSNGKIQLAPLHLLARDIIILLQENGTQLPLSSLGTLFQQKYGVSLCISDYGFQSMSSMLEHFSDYFVLRGKRQKRVVCLTSEMSGKKPAVSIIFLIFK